MKYKTVLKDPRGYHKGGDSFSSGFLAWAYGENWKLLQVGNSYEIQEELSDFTAEEERDRV
jgi:hypothetical protein